MQAFNYLEAEKMIKVGIIGATGYAGGELVRLLTGHRQAEIVRLEKLHR